MSVQHNSTNADALPCGKFCFSAEFAIDKTHPAKHESVRRGHPDAKLFQHSNCVRHQTFAAGLVDWRLGSIRYHDLEPSRACGDGRSEPGRAPSNHEHVRALSHLRLLKNDAENRTLCASPT
jgi:hypothetical protein